MGRKAIYINKNGHINIDSSELNIHEILNDIAKKPNIYIQTVTPKVFQVGDFWYDPIADIFSIARFVNSSTMWVVLPFLKDKTEQARVTLDVFTRTINELKNKYDLEIINLKKTIENLNKGGI